MGKFRFVCLLAAIAIATTGFAGFSPSADAGPPEINKHYCMPDFSVTVQAITTDVVKPSFSLQPQSSVIVFLSVRAAKNLVKPIDTGQDTHDVFLKPDFTFQFKAFDVYDQLPEYRAKRPVWAVYRLVQPPSRSTYKHKPPLLLKA